MGGGGVIEREVDVLVAARDAEIARLLARVAELEAIIEKLNTDAARTIDKIAAGLEKP